MRLSASAAVLLIAVVAVTGCASPSATDAEPSASVPSASAPSAPSPTPSPTPTPTRTPTPTPTRSEDPDDPATWVITEAGMGPIALGMPFSDALTSMPSGTTNDPDLCGWLAWWSAPAREYNVYTARPGNTSDDGPVSLVATEAWGDPTAAIGPRTASGVGVGSTVEDVRAEYPDAVEVADSIDSSIVHLQVGQMFFTYREDPVISSVTVTMAEAPPYELCG
ncbi:hypothetical protein ACI3KY_19425 [Microbacterium sp. ZW T2_14]|uniref:hypothetical protein n=1 Tax=Microbacterium sp. ZW T2_14 TaxID=3378079 RepID=UPI003853E7B6